MTDPQPSPPDHNFHVIPRNDLKPHVERGTACWCNPTATKQGRRLVIIHHAMDGRELVENYGPS